MPLYAFEVDDGKDVYGFTVIAPDDSTANRLAKRLGRAVLLGEVIEPDTTQLQVNKARMH